MEERRQENVKPPTPRGRVGFHFSAPRSQTGPIVVLAIVPADDYSDCSRQGASGEAEVFAVDCAGETLELALPIEPAIRDGSFVFGADDISSCVELDDMAKTASEEDQPTHLRPDDVAAI